MRWLMFRLTLFCLVLGVSSPAWATTYYVATTGSDAAAGTSEGAAFLTIQKCIDVVVAGDTCTVADGDYSVPATTRRLAYISVVDGTASNPITLKSTNPLGAKIAVPANATGSWGIDVSKEYWIIEGFDIHHGGATGGAATTGIGVYSSNTIIRNNTIRQIGQGICSAHTSGYQAIYLNSPVRNILIEENLIHTIGRLRTGEGGCAAGQSTNDHGIYAAGIYNGPVTIRRNVFYDNYRGWPIHIYHPGASITDHLDIYNNTFARKDLTDSHPLGHILLQTQTVRNVNIKNNLSYDPALGMVYCHGVAIVNASNNTISFNQTSASSINVSSCLAGFTFENNTVSTAPGFVNEAGNDFHLAAGSAAIDTGTDIGFPYNGTAPDIGAFESGGAPADVTPPATPTRVQIQ